MERSGTNDGKPTGESGDRQSPREDGYQSGIGNSKLAEDALLEERRLLTSIIAHIPSGVFWKDRDFRYQGCNKAFAHSAGVARPEDIVGKTDYELAWEQEQADYFRVCDRQVMEEDRPLLEIEEVERQADGRQAILLTSKVPLHDKDGQVCGVLGIDTDISHLKQVENELRQIRVELELRVQERTAELSSINAQLRREIRERERAEEAVKVSEERYRLVSELTSDYAYAIHVDSAGLCRVEWVTDAFARVTGHHPSEMEGRGAWDRIVHPDDLPIAERRIQSLLAGRSVVNEFRIVATDGRIRWVRDHARPMWDEAEGRVVRILGAAQDITDRKQAEEEARQHQAALAQVARLSTMGEMAAQLAHELNQPLCTMMGNAQTAQRLLASPTPDMAELRDALNDIVTFGKHGATVIKRLRDFLRQQQPQPVVLNVQRMIEEIVTFLEADARQHGARIRFDIADDLPTIQGDPIQLQQVLLNLVRNALEAMLALASDLREVTIQARRRQAEGVVISVSDSGPGLPPAVAARAFEPFFTTKPGGLGLGLAICRSVIEAHQGRLWAEPNTQSESHAGTTFSVLLPTIPQGVQ
jgi:PAS domain S-box-containing protein